MKACYLMIFAGMLMAGSALAQQPDKRWRFRSRKQCRLPSFRPNRP